jgi:hypothetical protein
MQKPVGEKPDKRTLAQRSATSAKLYTAERDRRHDQVALLAVQRPPRGRRRMSCRHSCQRSGGGHVISNSCHPPLEGRAIAYGVHKAYRLARFASPACGGGRRARRARRVGALSTQRIPMRKHPHPNPPPQAGEGAQVPMSLHLGPHMRLPYPQAGGWQRPRHDAALNLSLVTAKASVQILGRKHGGYRRARGGRS